MLEVLKFIVWDVQHGNALYFKTPNGKSVIIDLGTGRRFDRKSKFSPIAHLSRYGLKEIDLLVITHPHKDHIEDIIEATKLPISQVILPFHLKKKDYFPERVKNRKKLFDAYQKLSKEFKWKDWINIGDVKLRFFRYTEASRSRLNDHSVVTVIEYLDKKLVFMGDNEGISQRALLVNTRFQRLTKNCQIFLAPHHGRRDGYFAPMLGHLSPDLSIVSDANPGFTAQRNKYGQKSSGMEVKVGQVRQTRYVLSTSNDGVIIGELGLYKDEATFKIRTKKTSRR